ncbi:MAG: tRNA pseudouridine32 synthase / rRNA pseudouridine746 synthase [Acidobacteriota bacterium]|jgi:tRNA pseudouridine32 synthase/23S rRNA pseudouridine746 synthase|nr:tRNA pseudouridine32 synthase / rRNA pseudouridine746 synthase [Acidobacteriota bacterium]
MRGTLLSAPLPLVEGVAPSRQWLPEGAWETVLDFLKERHRGVEAADWLARMRKGQVVDETGLRLNARSPYRAGACIFYYRELEAEERIPFAERVLYQDEHLLVVDKPHFLPVVPSGRFLRETLLVRLREKGRLEHLVPVHRIDRETAGVIMFSLNPETRGAYASLFQRREVKKIYEALARRLPHLKLPLTRRSRIVKGEPFFRMKEVEGEPNSETHVDMVESKGDVIEMKDDLSLYRLSPTTGRKHQLRLHLSALGIPVENDRLYPVVSPVERVDFSSPLKLLAKSISFRDPLTGRRQYFESDRKLER